MHATAADTNDGNNAPRTSSNFLQSLSTLLQACHILSMSANHSAGTQVAAGSAAAAEQAAAEAAMLLRVADRMSELIGEVGQALVLELSHNLVQAQYHPSHAQHDGNNR